MAKFIYGKYNSTETVTYTWRQYDLEQTYTVEISGNASGIGDISLTYKQGYRNYTIDSNGIFQPVGSLVQVGTGATIYEEFNGTNQIKSYTTTYKSGYEKPYTYTKRTLTSVPGPKIKGTYRGTVTSTSSTAYPTNGESGSYWYDTRTSSASYSRGNYIGEVTAEDGVYPENGRHTDGYWYVKGGLANSAPAIDGYTGSTSIDLGTKSTDFNIEYTITDAEGGALTVDIFEDSTKVKSALAVQAGYKNTYVVNLSNFTLGAHYVKIVPKDSDGATSDRTYQFYKSNSAPVISGTDEDLGDKNSPFTQEFTVTDINGDNVSALVTLNGVEIMNVSNAIGQSHFINITQELLTGLPLGQRNTITVKADDGKGGATYRYYYFTRVNKAPIISGNDRDLGIVATVEEINGSFSATDLEGDDIAAKILLNGVEVTDIPSLADNQSIDYTFTKDSFIRLAKGQHTIKIVATDSQGESSERIITFTKQVSKLEFILKVNKTDVIATKILFILNAVIASGDELDIKATNNYSDTTPTWEDITAKSAVKMVHQYINTTKTAPQGEIAIWVKITKASAETLRSIVFGMSGGYE